VKVVASLSQGRTAAAQCGLCTYKSVPVIFETPCTCMFVRNMVTSQPSYILHYLENATMLQLATVFTFRHVSIPQQCLFRSCPICPCTGNNRTTHDNYHNYPHTSYHIHFLLAFTHSVLKVTNILCTVFLMSI